MAWDDVRTDGEVLMAAEWNAVIDEISTSRARAITLMAAGAIQTETYYAELDSTQTGALINYIYGIYPESTARLQWVTVMPTQWDEGNITPTACWTSTRVGGSVKWSLTARRYADTGALTIALAAGSTFDADASGGSRYQEITGSAFTPTGSGNFIVFEMTRDFDNDTLIGNARLIAIRLQYNVS